MSTVILEEALGTCNSFNNLRKKVDIMEEQLSDIRAISELQERMQIVENTLGTMEDVVHDVNAANIKANRSIEIVDDLNEELVKVQDTVRALQEAVAGLAVIALHPTPYKE